MDHAKRALSAQDGFKIKLEELLLRTHPDGQFDALHERGHVQRVVEIVGVDVRIGHRVPGPEPDRSPGPGPEQKRHDGPRVVVGDRPEYAVVDRVPDAEDLAHLDAVVGRYAGRRHVELDVRVVRVVGVRGGHEPEALDAAQRGHGPVIPGQVFHCHGHRL